MEENAEVGGGWSCSQFVMDRSAGEMCRILTVLLLVAAGLAAGERTVVVTPRPRWLVPEPRADPSNPSVPSILPARIPVFSLRVLPHSSKPALSAALPMEHRSKIPDLMVDAIPVQELAAVLRKPAHRPAPLQPIVVLSPTPAPAPAAFTHNSISLDKQEQAAPTSLRQSVFVESVPSLSIDIDKEEDESEEGLADYLTPPRYPSVYKTDYDAPLSSAPKEKYERNNFNSISDVDETSNDISDSLPTDFRKQKPGDRVEFQLHGQAGPKSYKFGFDTGAGKNRQFRYEEKDAVGNVKGHFGYYDTTGKLQMVKYHSDETGFHAVQVD